MCEIEPYNSDSNFVDADFNNDSLIIDTKFQVLDMSHFPDCKRIKGFISPDKQSSRIFNEDEKLYYNSKTNLIYRLCVPMIDQQQLIYTPQIYPLGWDFEFY